MWNIPCALVRWGLESSFVLAHLFLDQSRIWFHPYNNENIKKKTVKKLLTGFNSFYLINIFYIHNYTNKRIKESV